MLHKTNILEHYTLRFYFPYLSLLAQPVNIIQLMPALKVNIIIVHPWDVVFPRAKVNIIIVHPRVVAYGKIMLIILFMRYEYS